MRSLLDQTEPEWRHLADDPALEAEFKAWEKSRKTFNQDLHVPGSAAREQGWQRDYFRGVVPSGAAGPRAHRSRLRLPDFKKS
jgi:anti-sigma factor RsiW